MSGSEIGGWFAPRLDGAARTGLQSWSAADIAEYLQSGRNAKSHAGGPMAEVIVNSTSKMSDADVRAMAVYLKDLPPARREPKVMPPDEAEMKAGQAVYAKLCVACHEADGSGAPRIYPPLPANALLQSINPSSTLRIILDGAHTVTTPRAPNTGEMPGYAGQLSDEQIAAVTNYIRNSWGNAAPLVTPAQVAKARGQEPSVRNSLSPLLRLRSNPTSPQAGQGKTERLPLLVSGEHEFRHVPFVAHCEQAKADAEDEGEDGPEFGVEIKSERRRIEQSGHH